MNVIIVGGGQVGTYIANMLIENKCSVKVIENRDFVLGKLREELPPENIILGDGTDPNVLEAAGIAKADVVAAVTGADETNLVASTMAKFEFGVPRVIARINNPKNAWLFDAGMGVDIAINQANLMAHLVVEEIDFKNIFTLMKMYGGAYSIVQVEASGESAAVNKAIKDLPIPGNAVLIAIYRGREVIIPHGNTVIMGDDKLLAFADAASQVNLNEMFSARQ